MNKKKILIDTDVIIDFLQGNSKAKKYIKSNFASTILSSVTVAELYSEIRDGKEKELLDALIDLVDVIPVTSDIAEKAGLLKREYFKSHRTGLADAIIAATAEMHAADLKTFSIKHFPMIKALKPPYRKG